MVKPSTKDKLWTFANAAIVAAAAATATISIHFALATREVQHNTIEQQNEIIEQQRRTIDSLLSGHRRCVDPAHAASARGSGAQDMP